MGGVAIASRLGAWVDRASGIALVGFGTWIALSALRDLRAPSGHGHSHGRSGPIHGPELQRVKSEGSDIEVSIYEMGLSPRFRLTGAVTGTVKLETLRDDGRTQVFMMAMLGAYWESTEEIPEPHQFFVLVHIEDAKGGPRQHYRTRFEEPAHGHAYTHGPLVRGLPPEATRDALYAPLRSGAAGLPMRTPTGTAWALSTRIGMTTRPPPRTRTQRRPTCRCTRTATRPPAGRRCS